MADMRAPSGAIVHAPDSAVRALTAAGFTEAGAKAAAEKPAEAKAERTAKPRKTRK